MCQLDFVSVSLNLIVPQLWTEGWQGLWCRERKEEICEQRLQEAKRIVSGAFREEGDQKKSITW